VVNRAPRPGRPAGSSRTLTTSSCHSANLLRSRRARPEEPLDGRRPEPAAARGPGIDPEEAALLADSVGLALLVVLDTLTPAERLAFVLHDMTTVDVIADPARLSALTVSRP